MNEGAVDYGGCQKEGCAERPIAPCDACLGEGQTRYVGDDARGFGLLDIRRLADDESIRNQSGEKDGAAKA